MDRYIVISKHTTEDCRMAVKHFKQHHAGYLTHYEWGCYDDDHTAYCIMEAESHAQALNTVPPLFREKARAVKLVYFKPRAKGDSLHKDQTEH